jgi:UDP-glucose 4-epimerase
MNVLVTGGAGYIGSVIAARLLAAGHTVTVYDDLSRGHAAAVPAGAALVTADIRDAARLTAALTAGGCEAIVHMAALAEVAESVAFPERYHDVNVGGAEAVLEAALRTGVSRIVFSSTAAVYGAPERVPIDEDAVLAPANPYGETKLAAERLLSEAASPPSRCATSTPPAPTARAARTTFPKATWCRWRSPRRATARPRRSSATTTPRPTAPACATTFT